ncbi:MAG TPA: 2OG-Fe(II) oxygenase [Rhizomicrobium sp.]
MTAQQSGGMKATVWKDFLPIEVMSGLLDFVAATESKFESSSVGFADRGFVVDPTRRISLVSSDFGPFHEALGKRMMSLAPAMIRALGLPPFLPALVELELAAHGDGAFFARHTDAQTARSDGLERLLSGVYYFNREPKAFTGGALRLYPPRPAASGVPFADVPPERNSCVFFPASMPHEVMPVSCPSGQFMDSRFAINLWFVGRV